MLATGRGEILRRLPDLPAVSVILAKPPVSVSTAWAYKTFDRIGSARHPDTKAMLAALSEKNQEKVAHSLVNVLEEVTIREHPIIATYKRILTDNGALASLMSGSGPTVFGLSESRENAEKAAQALSRAYPDAAVFVAPTTGKNSI